VSDGCISQYTKQFGDIHIDARVCIIASNVQSVVSGSDQQQKLLRISRRLHRMGKIIQDDSHFAGQNNCGLLSTADEDAVSSSC
jgi:hypothetical protein